MQNLKVLILTIPHGAAHQRIAEALRKALLEIRADLEVEVVNALDHCTHWFRIYYDSFEIPMKYWHALWEWIENLQHQGESTSPAWLYRRGAQPLFRYIQAFNPDVVIATEVGLCEIAVMLKRETHARFHLVGAGALDFDRAWAQPEVDLYPAAPGDVAAQLEAAGVSPHKILPCGMPVDPAFGSILDRSAVRARLEVEPDIPLLLVTFGGTGAAKPRLILPELKKVRQPFQAVFITRRNQRLHDEVQRLCQGRRQFRALGWVDNMHEWMAAADLLLGRAGGTLVAEAINSGLPILAFNLPPGDERRTCDLIEKKWHVGYWVKHQKDLAPTIARLLADPGELRRLRQNALLLARPQAAQEAAEAILELCQPHASINTASRD